jgi:hypothetical protein
MLITPDSKPLASVKLMGASNDVVEPASVSLVDENGSNNVNNNIINNNEKMKELFDLLPSPIKGNADWRDYRCLQLQNGVTVCLVHDPESKTTAAAAAVNVGAAADPRNLSGLARTYDCFVFLILFTKIVTMLRSVHYLKSCINRSK